ncbi:MAG: L,D-transpeptidase [Deltaproteobacteria bacterium]|nr:L,D-transpeptidase [Deltaproteobacteria bacterium]
MTRIAIRRIGCASLLLLAALPSDGHAQQVDASPYLPASVAVRSERVAVYREPDSRASRRGTAAEGNRLPAYRFAEGRGCGSWWVEVYAEGWICGDYLVPSAMAPDAAALPILPEGQLTPYPCAFAHEGGAAVFDRLSDASLNWSSRWLEEGWAVSVRRRTTYEGERYYGTAGGDYVRASEVFLARPSTFRGEELSGFQDLGWTFRSSTRIQDRLPGTGSTSDRSIGPQIVLRFAAEHEVGTTSWLELVDDGGFVRASDVRRPDYLAPPEEVGPYDVWFDVNRSSQTLVAYRGDQPIYATLVSSGRAGHSTPPGTFRVWVKLITDRMANEEPSNPEEKPYYLEDVPWVMYFNDDIALHGAYWHKAFGHVRSHGCVNLAPFDARWVFDHAQPALPRGWWSVLPTADDPGSVVHVR